MNHCELNVTQLKMGDVPFHIGEATTKVVGGASGDVQPRAGRVNEMCREWLVREDGALAYRLQSQEINEHYTGNKHRNAQVREDFPCALDEQIREQQLAEQAAAVYHQMLAEQEEIDNRLAQELAEKLEREEMARKRALELRDEEIARQLLEKERLKQELLRDQRLELQQQQQLQQQARGNHHQQRYSSPQKASPPPPPSLNATSPGVYQNVLPKYPSPHRPDNSNYYANVPRKGAPMPLPSETITVVDSAPYKDYKEQVIIRDAEDSAGLYTEPYRPYENLNDKFNRIEIAEVGLPIDEVVERQLQEAKDAELARKLQEQESLSEESVKLNRDRMLAIEAQDKELAKLLQERERAKVKRARERAKQKSLAKKQMQQQQQHQQILNPSSQIMPDDAYAFPADVIPAHHSDNVNYSEVVNARIPGSSLTSSSFSSSASGSRNADLLLRDNSREKESFVDDADDINYSFPADIVKGNPYSPQKSKIEGARYFRERESSRMSNSPPSTVNMSASGSGYHSSFTTPEKINNGESYTPVRPTQLDLKSPLRPAKYKNQQVEPDIISESSKLSHHHKAASPTSSITSTGTHLTNIAMVIDPTYKRQTGAIAASSGLNSLIQSPPSYDTTSSSTVTTSTSSSSPGLILPPPDISENEGDTSPVPPYMPIQGQRRTASLEKKKKKEKKAIDGCKQQ